MTAIYVPSRGPDSWRSLVASPERHWVVGRSARTLANCWEAGAGLPPEIVRVLDPLVGPVELLFALPEHKVRLRGGGRDSQSDVFALLRGGGATIACTIEGKVDEPFGPTLGEWLTDASAGKRERLAHVAELLGLPAELDRGVRYQLLHRAAAAVVEAQRFVAGAAAMIVHSFSPDRRWLADFAAFARLFGREATAGSAVRASLPCGRPLYLGWADGEQRFRAS